MKKKQQQQFSKDFLYHIKPVHQVEAIKKNGIIAPVDKKIWFFTHLSWNGFNIADKIAYSQVFLQEYALFKVYKKGLTKKIEKEYVGEMTTEFHRVIEQERIAPEFIEHIGNFKINIAASFRNQGLAEKVIKRLVKQEEEFIKIMAKSKTERLFRLAA